MYTLQQFRRFRWAVVVAAIAVLVPAAAAQARPAQTAARSDVSFSVRSAPERASSALTQTDFAVRALRPTSPARIGANANPATYTDPIGDSGTAPDISTIVVSSDVNGQITLRISTNEPTLASDAAIYLNLDSDQNSATGNPDHGGAEYVLSIVGTNRSFGAVQWKDSTWVYASLPSLSASYTNGVATFTVNASDLGNPTPTGFNFYVAAQVGTSSNPSAYDLAPDYGVWNYQLTPTLTDSGAEAQFIEQADAICARTDANNLPFPPGAPTDRATVLANLSNGGVANVRNEVAAIVALKPPATDQPLFEQLKPLLRRLLKASARANAAHKRHDTRAVSAALKTANSANTKATAIARKLGLTVCSNGWGPYGG